MKITLNQILAIILFAGLVYPLEGSSQDQRENVNFQHKIGIGGLPLGSNEYYITASYNRILKKRNELEFPIYYHKAGNNNEVMVGIAFNWATIKKDTRFNFFISPELQFNDYWYPKYDSNITASHYGFFICLGLIPSFQISSRFSIAIECKTGYGRQWGYNDEGVFVKYFTHNGWYGKNFGALKLYYHF